MIKKLLFQSQLIQSTLFHSKRYLSGLNGVQYSQVFDAINLKNQLNQLSHDAIRFTLLDNEKRELTQEEKKTDRVVQSYFPSAFYEIGVYEAVNKELSDEKVNYPRNCYYEVKLPCSSNEIIRKFMELLNTKSIRIGRILELYDYVATTVAYKYVYMQQATIMAACVDNIQFYRRIHHDRDIIVRGYPTHTGKSSIEVQLDLLQVNSRNQLELAAKANFLLVARSKESHNKTAHQVPVFKFDGEKSVRNCNILYQLGIQNQTRRKNAAATSLKKQPPSYNESLTVHSFFTSEEAKKDKKQINLTHISKKLIMHKQDQNLHGNIFGGYIMREAYELGWLCGYLHTNKQKIEVYAIDDFQFINGVDLGSILELHAKIGYISEDNVIHILVECFKVNKSQERLKTNDLHLTFVAEKDAKIQKVFPETYTEAMIYLDSQRRVQNCMHSS
ncbi:hypothetical protein ABPG74_022147 [Tetrahymena malaccensis]